MATHTKGTWSVNWSDRTIVSLTGEKMERERPLAEIVGTDAEADATARVMAAAADTLFALKAAAGHLREVLNDPDCRHLHPIGSCPVLDQAVAAIAKAEGRS